MSKWNVTYDRVTEESAREGGYADSGFLLEGAPLRDSIETFTERADTIEANVYPLGDGSSIRWFTAYPSPGDLGPEGESETRSLHIPECVSAPSRLRLARMLGCYGVR